jgi:small subunit ribosomal protein S25e
MCARLSQPPKVQQKSKEQKMAAAMAGGKSKKKVSTCLTSLHALSAHACPSPHPPHHSHHLLCLPREQKWSKAKSRDANANKVQFEEELYTRFMAEVPKVRYVLLPGATLEAERLLWLLTRCSEAQASLEASPPYIDCFKLIAAQLGAHLLAPFVLFF